MVGQKLIKSGTIEFKPATTSFLPRGFRFSPWKMCRAELVITDGGSPELNIYNPKEHSLMEVYVLENIDDVVACGSKTRAHAFEIISGTKSLVILSGSTELESRAWIWTLKKLFWPDIIVQPVEGENQLQLVPTADSDRLKLPSGVYDVEVSVVCISLRLLYKCHTDDSRLTPVEPFSGQEGRDSLNVPLTTIRQLRKEAAGHTTCLAVVTTADGECGEVTLMLKQSEDSGCSIATMMDIIKNAVARATDNLHECLSSTKWRSD